MSRSPLDDPKVRDRVFREMLRRAELPQPLAEYRFALPRKWRFDYAWEEHLALEVQGGVWVQGRHSRGSGLVKEHEKLNAAAERGWRMLYVTPRDLCKPKTIALIKRALWGTE